MLRVVTSKICFHICGFSSDYLAIPNDPRIEKCVSLFDLKKDMILVLWKLFNKISHGSATIGIEDFCHKFLDLKRNIMIDSILDLVECKSPGRITFGEFVQIVSQFACFEQKDILKFCFYSLDPTKTGTVEKNELKHFVHEIWGNNFSGNIDQGLSYLDKHDDGTGRFTFEQFYEMQLACPSLLYPSFKLHQNIIRHSFGDIYWDWKKRDIADGYEVREVNEQETKLQLSEADDPNHKLNDNIVKKRMGISWYIQPWKRNVFRRKIARIAAITASIDESLSTKK